MSRAPETVQRLGRLARSLFRRVPRRELGILIIVLVLYLMIRSSNPQAQSVRNHQQLAERIALFGVLTLGAGALIISGGIDLSIGSVLCLAGVALGLLLNSSPGHIAKLSLLVFAVLVCAHGAWYLWSRLRRVGEWAVTGLLYLTWPLTLFWMRRFPRVQKAVIERGAPLPVLGGLLILCIGLVLGLDVGHAALDYPLEEVPALLSVLLVLLGAAHIGLFHGLLVTALRLQPFVVTLCGLFVWRGVALWLALPDPMAPLRGLARALSGGRFFANAVIETGSAGTIGIGQVEQQYERLIFLSTGSLTGLRDLPLIGWLGYVPVRFFLLLLVALLAFVLLHLSVHGRYLYAVGANEQAARYAGIRTERYKVLAYVLCSTMAALGGILLMLELNTVQPSSSGQFYELYAITGAVLGGCSLRGGEGTVLGMLFGTAVLPLLENLINFSRLPDSLQPLFIGFALLIGTIADELIKRRAAARKQA
jgi:ribose transport system permease protein